MADKEIFTGHTPAHLKNTEKILSLGSDRTEAVSPTIFVQSICKPTLTETREDINVVEWSNGLEIIESEAITTHQITSNPFSYYFIKHLEIKIVHRDALCLTSVMQSTIINLFNSPRD